MLARRCEPGSRLHALLLGPVAPHELLADGRDRDRRARLRAGTPRLRAVRVERVQDVGLRHPVRVRQERIACRLEAAHHPGVSAAPDEQADGPPVRPDGLGRDLHRLLEAVGPDDPVRACAADDETRRPAADGGALALEPVRPRTAPRARQVLQAALGLRAAIRAWLDDVEHHLHARADALDEVPLRDVVALAGEVHAVGRSGRYVRRHGERARAQRHRERDGDDCGEPPCGRDRCVAHQVSEDTLIPGSWFPGRPVASSAGGPDLPPPPARPGESRATQIRDLTHGSDPELVVRLPGCARSQLI